MQHIVAPMDFLLTASPVAALAVACFLGLFAAGTVLVITSIAARSLPMRVQTRIDEIDQALSLVEQNSLELRSQWANTIEQLDAFEASIEKKRRQLAAAASRAERANQASETAESEQVAMPLAPEAQLIELRRKIYGSG